MAKALTIIMLLAATAAFAAAHPGLGKGGFGNIMVTGGANSTAAEGNATATTATIGHHKGQDLSNCECKDDCKVETRKVCKEEPKEEEVCKDEEVEEEVVVCENKCFKADKVITIGHGGKGRRLLSANSMNIIPHMGKAAVIGAGSHNSHNATEESGAKQQEICREICKPKTKKSMVKNCQKVQSVELVDCKDEVVSSRCVKKCNCGEKTITVSKTPDFGAIFSHGKGK